MNDHQAIAEKIDNGLASFAQKVAGPSDLYNYSYLGYVSCYIYINFSDSHMIEIYYYCSEVTTLISMGDPDAVDKAVKAVNRHYESIR